MPAIVCLLFIKHLRCCTLVTRHMDKEDTSPPSSYVHSGGGAGRGRKSHRGVEAEMGRRAGPGRAGRGAGGRRWRRAQHGPVGLCREASRRGRSAALCSASRRLRSVRHGRGSAETSTGGPASPDPLQRCVFCSGGFGRQPQHVPGQDGVSQPHAERTTCPRSAGSVPAVHWEADVLPSPGVC